MPKKKIDAVLEAGVWAPSGMNQQPWRFAVIEDKKVIGKLSNETKKILLTKEFAKGYAQMLHSDTDMVFYDAPLLILVCVKRNTEWKDVNLLDCGLAAQNMLLKAYELGLGSCFIGFGNFLNEKPDVLEKAGVPEGYDVIAPLIFGFAQEQVDAKPRQVNTLSWIK